MEIEMDTFDAGKLFKVDRLISETLINGIRFKIFTWYQLVSKF